MSRRRHRPEKCPFDRKGNLQNNPALASEWRINKAFTSILKFEHVLWRKNSPPLIILRDQQYYTFPVFLNSMDTILKNSQVVIRDGRIEGTWIVVKVGDRYGLEAITSTGVSNRGTDSDDEERDFLW